MLVKLVQPLKASLILILVTLFDIFKLVFPPGQQINVVLFLLYKHPSCDE